MNDRFFLHRAWPVLGFLAGIAAASAEPSEEILGALPPGLYAVIDTERGEIIAELFHEIAPLTVANFAGLAEGALENSFREKGEPFYDGLTFHRVVPGFVIQGGDPDGTGEGGPGYTFPDEFSPALRHGESGMLSMANEGPNTNGSQFFITLDDRQDRLNYKHSVFGKVIHGMDVVRAIRAGDVMRSVDIFRKGAEAESFATGQESWERRLSEFSAIPDPIGPLPYFFDFGGLEFPGWFPQWFGEKLYHYEIVRGTRILVRTYRRFEPAGPEDTPDRWVRRLVSMMGETDGPAEPRLVFVAYFAESDRWVVYASPGLWPRLYPEATSNPVEDLLVEAGTLFTEPTPRRLVDGVTTVIINRLDRWWREGEPPSQP